MKKSMFNILVAGFIALSPVISDAMMCGGMMGGNTGDKICPVSGEKIHEKTAATYKYEGKTYNFCCPMCIEEFKKNPAKYIERMGKTKESKEDEGTNKNQQHSH